MNIRQLIDWGTKELIAFDSTRLDAELLLGHVLGQDRTYLISHDDDKVGFWNDYKFRQFIGKRKKGVPVAYITGFKEFYGIDIRVNRHCLVPRPDTEIMVASVIEYLNPGDLLLDVGTGSGCIPIAVLSHVSDVNAVASDISRSALSVAKDNVKWLGLSDKIMLIESDLLKQIPMELFDGKDLVVTSNLPYVPEDYRISLETQYEPGVSLYGGHDGLEIYKKLLDQLAIVRPKAMFLECYEFQKAILADYLPDYKLKFCENALGEARILMLERTEK